MRVCVSVYLCVCMVYVCVCVRVHRVCAFVLVCPCVLDVFLYECVYACLFVFACVFL